MKIWVESNISGRFLLCRACHTVIAKEALQVVTHSSQLGVSVCHLACWRAERVVPMQFSWFQFGNIEAESRIQEVKDWVEAWNLQFRPRGDLVPATFLKKAVITAETAIRRLLLCVYQYLSGREVDTTVAYVCKAWFHVSRAEEIWQTLFLREFQSPETEKKGHFRRQYIAYVLAACWHCKSIKSLGEIYWKCGIYQRPLCKECARKPACSIIAISSYVCTYKVSKYVLKDCALPSFLVNGAPHTYYHLLRAKLQPHAETRRKLLLSTLDADFPGRLQAWERAEVQAFDLGQFYGEWISMSMTALHWALVKFCGKTGKREDVQRSCEEFLQALVNRR